MMHLGQSLVSENIWRIIMLNIFVAGKSEGQRRGDGVE